MDVQVNAEIGIRDMTDADLVSVVEIVNREIAESPYVWGDVPVTVEARRDWLARHRELGQPAVVATSATDDRVVGWGSLSTFRPATGYRFTLEASVYVARDAQRRGIGRRLIAELHERACAAGLQAIVAVIDAENAGSIALFRSLGYAEVGRLEAIGRKFGMWRDEVFLLKRIEPTAGKAKDNSRVLTTGLPDVGNDERPG
jgi:L-amino acid N-acyltransferase